MSLWKQTLHCRCLYTSGPAPCSGIHGPRAGRLFAWGRLPLLPGVGSCNARPLLPGLDRPCTCVIRSSSLSMVPVGFLSCFDGIGTDASFFPPMDALDVWYFGWTDVSRGDGILFWWCTFSWIGFHRILYVFVLVHSPSMTLDRPWCWLFHPCHRIWVGLSPLSSHVGIHRLGLTHLFYRWEGRRGAFWSPSIPPPPFDRP